MTRVKTASLADFPKLLKEWETLCDEGPWPDTRRENGARWLIGEWMAKDPDGPLGVDVNYHSIAGELLAQLDPARAVALALGPASESDQYDYLRSAARQEIVEKYPALYLKFNPGGNAGDSESGRDWSRAVINLAKSDPAAAAGAWLGWKGTDPADTDTLFAVVSEWQTRDAAAPEKWVNELADPEMRHIGTHAWLSMLARKDPRAALANLPFVELGDVLATPGDEGPGQKLIERTGDAQAEIAKQLARVDLAAALAAINSLEGRFLPPPDNEGKAADPSVDIRHLIAGSGTRNLPDDPTAFFQMLRDTIKSVPWKGGKAEMNELEKDFIGFKMDQWDTRQCLTAAGLRAEALDTIDEDKATEWLISRAVQMDPGTAIAALHSVPAQVRTALFKNIFDQASLDTGERQSLLTNAGPEQWDSLLGETLGRNPEQFASLVASLPAETTRNSRESFLHGWAQQNPGAALQWFAEHFNDTAAGASAQGLASGWASLDTDAATQWVASLPAGASRDGAAAGIAKAITSDDPGLAWQWASTITDVSLRARSLVEISRLWGDEAPDDFRAAVAADRAVAGLPAEEQERTAPNDK